MQIELRSFGVIPSADPIAYSAVRLKRDARMTGAAPAIAAIAVATSAAAGGGVANVRLRRHSPSPTAPLASGFDRTRLEPKSLASLFAAGSAGARPEQAGKVTCRHRQLSDEPGGSQRGRIGSDDTYLIEADLQVDAAAFQVPADRAH